MTPAASSRDGRIHMFSGGVANAGLKLSECCRAAHLSVFLIAVVALLMVIPVMSGGGTSLAPVANPLLAAMNKSRLRSLVLCDTTLREELRHCSVHSSFPMLFGVDFLLGTAVENSFQFFAEPARIRQELISLLGRRIS